MIPGTACTDDDVRQAIPFTVADKDSLPGTDANPYLLCTPTQFEAFMTDCYSGCTGTHFHLGADLDLSSVSYQRPKNFHGTLDGGGHTIFAFDASHEDGSGLFELLYGTVRNVTFDEAQYIATNTTHSHGIVASSSYGTISDVIVSGSASGQGNLGGLVGIANGGTISSCVTDISITAQATTTQNVGLVASQTANTAISSCTVAGSVSSSGSGIDRVGGVVGNMETTSSISNTISDVTLNLTAGAGNDAIGGLVGRMGSGLIEDCRVTIGLTVTGTDAGGVVGQLLGGTVQRVEVSGNVAASANVGGLVGIQSGGTLLDSAAWGTITATTGIAGGLAGVVEGGASITRAYSTGTVTAGTDAGGLVGAGTVTLSSSFSLAQVNGSGLLGGIIGDDDASTYSAVAWFSSSSSCSGAGGILTGCEKASMASDFHATGTNAGETVLSDWDFDTSWMAAPMDLPTLRDP